MSESFYLLHDPKDFEGKRSQSIKRTKRIQKLVKLMHDKIDKLDWLKDQLFDDEECIERMWDLLGGDTFGQFRELVQLVKKERDLVVAEKEE